MTITMAPKIKVEEYCTEVPLPPDVPSSATLRVKVKEEPTCTSSNFPLPRKAAKRTKTMHSQGMERNEKRGRFVNARGNQILLVVADKEFLEDTSTLACSSVIQNIVQAGDRFVNFGSEKDPDEWILVRQLLDPFSDVRLSRGNLPTALQWFQDLGIVRGITQCDDFLSQKVLSNSLPLKRSAFNNDLVMKPTEMLDILDYCPLIFDFNLTQSKKKSLDIILEVLEEGPFWLSLELIEKIVCLVATHKECEEALMKMLMKYVPDQCPRRGKELLLNPLFPLLVLSSVQRQREGKDKLADMKRKMDRVVQVIANAKPRSNVASLKKELKKDKACRKLLPKGF